MPPLLNVAQHAALAVVLCYLEQSLRQAETWLQGQQTTGILYRTSVQLSAERRAAVSARIAEALEGIARLAERFSLQPVDEPLENKIASEMSINWANLVDTRSDKLGRYGSVDPKLQELLDPEIEHLAQLALEIASLAREGTEEAFNEPDSAHHDSSDL